MCTMPNGAPKRNRWTVFFLYRAVYRSVAIIAAPPSVLPLAAEVLGPDRGPALVRQAHAEVLQSAVQNVGTVPGAVHPGLHDVGRGALTLRDVLRRAGPPVSRVRDAGGEAGAVQRRVREVVVGGH